MSPVVEIVTCDKCHQFYDVLMNLLTLSILSDCPGIAIIGCEIAVLCCSVLSSISLSGQRSLSQKEGGTIVTRTAYLAIGSPPSASSLIQQSL